MATAFGQKHAIYLAQKIYNIILILIKQIKNFTQFKKGFKEMVV